MRGLPTEALIRRLSVSDYAAMEVEVARMSDEELARAIEQDEQDS
jgi:hypothetical protein